MIVIPTWAKMEKQFQEDQLTHPHNLEILSNVAVY